MTDRRRPGDVNGVMVGILIAGSYFTGLVDDLFKIGRTANRRLQPGVNDRRCSIFADQVTGNDLVIHGNCLAARDQFFGPGQFRIQQRLDNQFLAAVLVGFGMSPVVIGERINPDHLRHLPHVPRHVLHESNGIWLEDTAGQIDRYRQHLIVAETTFEGVELGQQRIGFPKPDAIAEVGL